MRKRAHRSAFALLVAPLRGLPGFRAAAFDWYEQACFEGRGTARVNRALRHRGVRWTFDEMLKAHYSVRRLEELVYQSSPFLTLIDRSPNE